MRWKVIALLACVAASGALAQEKSVLISEDDDWKLYTRPGIKISDVGGDDAAIADLGIGTTMNDQLHLGIAGDILINDVVTQDSGQDIPRWDFWYIGADFGWTFNPDSLVHVTINTIVGGGSVKIEEGSDEGFWVVEPGIALAINLSDSWEFGVGGTYRYITGADAPGLDDDELNEPTLNIFFRAHEF